MEEKDWMEEPEVIEEEPTAAEIPETEEPPEVIEIPETEEPPEIHPADMKPQKSNKNIAVVIITLLFMFAIGLCIFIAVSLSDVISDAEKKPDKEYESETGNPWEEILGEDFLNKDDKPEAEKTAPEQSETTEIPPADDSNMDDFAYEFQPPEIDIPDVQLPDFNEEDPLEPYYENMQEDYPNHARDSFEGPYYPGIVNSIDESVSYKMERVSDVYKNPMYNVLFINSYIELSGDIPNLEEINRTIREDVMMFQRNYEAGADNLNEMLQQNDFPLYGESAAYVTYNSEDMISIVIKKNMELGYTTTDASVYCYNIDLKTGEILKNSSILKLSDDFAEEFRKKSTQQNGLSDATESYTDEEILAFLRVDQTLILFYTPLGLELGYNHRGGWITITLQDYEQYIAVGN